ncbi:hypothetical protein B0T20DRAFT_453112 [Sordaria brevicollis]|uniref:Uncharacterized protein n=1 Tax=Sordaria brevicollis TaxID=83679 RepID=A0AAE0UC52_SORBR|nr:hypothetical protein B0T20DRAFT_453112 [Sordaria brevicollis]
MFFEHERSLRVSIYTIVAITTTWGPPLLGGVTSRGPTGFELQFTILSCFLVLAVPAIALGVPETAYDRTYTLPRIDEASESPYKASMCQGIRRDRILDIITDYIVKMKPYSYTRGSADLVTLLQASRAFIAPTTLILLFMSFLPYSSLWALSSSLSLVLSPNHSSTTIGTLMTGPWLFATATAAIFTLLPLFLPQLQLQFPFLAFIPQQINKKITTAAITTGSLIAFIGILGFGLHIDAGIRSDKISDTLNLPALSFILGLLAAGSYIMDIVSRPLIRSVTTASTSNNQKVATRNENENDMVAGVTCWKTLFAGILVIAVPPSSAASLSEGHGLRDVSIGFAVVQVVIGAVVMGVWWFYGEAGEAVVKKWDARVLKLEDDGPSGATVNGNGTVGGREGSFFDTD